jgi:hypothetical protein
MVKMERLSEKNKRKLIKRSMPKSKSKILVVIESLDVNDSSGTKGRVALLHSLTQLGYDVTALHYTQKEIAMDGIRCIEAKELKDSLLFLLTRIQRLIHRWFKIDVGERIDRLFGFSFGFFNDTKSIAKAVKKLNPEDYLMVWTLSKGNSYRTHKAVLMLPEWHSKWYAYVHDPYPQQLYPRPYNFIPRGYREKRMFFLEVMKKAKRVVLPSLLLKEWLQSYYPDMEGKCLILPHQIVNYKMEEIVFPNYFDPGNFNLLHAGNLLDLRDPKPLVEAFEIFLERNPEAAKQSRLLFLGKAGAFASYLQHKMKEIPQLFASDGYVPFDETYAMQQSASANIILEAKSEISPFLPGKFPHSVSAKVPIILVGPYYSECKRLLGADYPYKFDFNDAEKMAEAFASLYTLWETHAKKIPFHRPDLDDYLSLNYVESLLEEGSGRQPV